VKAGRVPALATTGARRSPLLPDVPAITEAGVANAQADIWRRCKRYEVGTTHAESLDPRNPVFASALRRCVQLIREAARERPPIAYRVQGGVSSA
jgi:hypothetical protein